jgi:ABC-2 type transport system permease protein
MTRSIRAEWLKLRTVRSTGWALTALLAGTVLFTALVCATASSGGCAPETCDDYVVVNSLTGVFVGEIAVVALGVLAIGSEYATGMIRTTFAAEPRRRLVLAVKALGVGALALAAGLASAVVSYLVGGALLSSKGYPSLALADGLAPVAVISLYLAALALLSLGIGAVLRSTAGAVTCVLSLLLLPLIAAPLLGERTGEQLLDIAPMSAGLALLRNIDRIDGVTAGEWRGLGVTWLWALAALALALWLIGRRDVTPR